MSVAVVQFEKYMALIQGFRAYVGTWIHSVEVFRVPEVTVEPVVQQSATTWVAPLTGLGQPDVVNAVALQECAFGPQ